MNTPPSTPAKRRWLRVVLGLILLAVPVSAVGYRFWWIPACQSAECSLQLSHYNIAVHSCGIDADAHEAWKSPEATRQMVLKNFDQQLPDCPAGGKCQLVHGRGAHPWLPRAVCSLEKSRGHVDRSLPPEEDGKSP
ncbi:hypothetical protein OKA05_21120 [Luteolibacter arcticus]|uniref:Uncharacterized protein n=1 Tax=Luteolibacter arcticus TaxID=1581411 RepID=A0ABT3GNM2_9BACT|nr:hypothetical protein [Luteolibacter arcticus]MCW1925076.1 hypothetical protein [Luteolibacter arcticus]